MSEHRPYACKVCFTTELYPYKYFFFEDGKNLGHTVDVLGLLLVHSESTSGSVGGDQVK